jgi:hypothetical protein
MRTIDPFLLISLLLPVLALVAGAGCLPQEALSPADYAAEAEPVAPAANRVAVGHIDVPSDETEEVSDLHAVAVPVSRSDRPRADPVFFPLGAGYGALGRVDVLPCRDRGLPAGYLRIRATFRPNGHVAHAAVESLAEPPEEALSCIGEQLEATTVPPFDGGDVTLSRIYFVD